MDPSDLPFVIDLHRPILALRFAGPRRMLSWSISQPGLTVANAVAWLEVKDTDLPVGRDPVAVLSDALAQGDLSNAVGLMTACDVSAYQICRTTIAGAEAIAVTTVGLGNGEFVGRRRFAGNAWEPPSPGTVNTFVHVSQPLSDGALVETIAIAAQARTVAILQATESTGCEAITGTGSDCIVVAAPLGGTICYSGLHTAIGEAVGASVMEATRAGAIRWIGQTARRLATDRSTRTEKDGLENGLDASWLFGSEQ